MKTNSATLVGLSLLLMLANVASVEAAKSYNFNCPRGYVMLGLHGSQGSWMNGVLARCVKIKSDGTIDRKKFKYTKRAGAKISNDAFNKSKLVKCPKAKVMVGFTGGTGTYVNAITSITCQKWNKSTRTTSGRVSSHKMFPIKGKGTYSQTLCQNGMVGLGIKGKHGIYLDRFAVKCGFASGAKPAKTTTKPRRRTTGTVKKSSGGRSCVPANVPCPNGTICRRC